MSDNTIIIRYGVCYFFGEIVFEKQITVLVLINNLEMFSFKAMLQDDLNILNHEMLSLQIKDDILIHTPENNSKSKKDILQFDISTLENYAEVGKFMVMEK